MSSFAVPIIERIAVQMVNQALVTVYIALTTDGGSPITT